MTTAVDETITLARIGTAHGVAGWLKVNIFTESVDSLLALQPWLIQQKDQWQTLDIEDTRLMGEQLQIKIRGCDNREAARHYTNLYIGVPREQMPEPPANEFYQTDLIGLDVVDSNGKHLGKVTDVMETGANDVFVIEGEINTAIPYTDHVVKAIDLEQKRMVVDWDPEY